MRVHPATATRVLRSEAAQRGHRAPPDEAAFDIIIATNILPYFNDVELMLAMSNIAGMLAPVEACSCTTSRGLRCWM